MVARLPAVPSFPDGARTLLEHVAPAREVGLLQDVEDHVGSPGGRQRVGDVSDSRQSAGEVAVTLDLDVTDEVVQHILLTAAWHEAEEEGGTRWRTGSRHSSPLLVEERVVKRVRDIVGEFAVSRCVVVTMEHAGDLAHQPGGPVVEAGAEQATTGLLDGDPVVSPGV